MAFDLLITQFLEDYWRLYPVEATHAGVHAHDAQLQDWSPAGQDERRAWRARATEALAAADDATLDPGQRIDKRVALAQLALFDVQDGWQYARRAPSLYVEHALSGLHYLLARPDQAASPAERDAHLAARLRGVPQLLAQGRANIDPALVPPEYADIARTNISGALGFVEALELPAAAEDARRAALAALAQYRDFVAGLAARGAFAAGRELYERILQQHHGLRLSAQDVHDTGARLADALQDQMTRLAQAIAPGARWQDIVEGLKARHPAREGLLQAYHDEMVRAREFVRARNLVEIPDGERCEIRPTAPFLRATMPLGHFDKTPPFDARDNLGILYITPIDAGLPAARQEELLQAHCDTAVRSICFHETYPGHHLQFWWSKLRANPLRRQFPSNVYLEGWALYCEEMMEENGFFETRELQLWQLKNSMWRAVRMMIDSGLHTGALSLAQGAQLLVERAGLEPNTARGEVLRYTNTPTQPSSYMLGKLRVMELREQYRKRMGAGYRLGGFHSRFLDYSSVSPALIPDGL